MPTTFLTRAEQLAAYDVDARFIASALIASLPAGTITALAGLLLQHQARRVTNATGRS